MSLLFVDGFDAQDTGSKWFTVATGAGSVSWTASTRFGAGFAAQFSHNVAYVQYGAQRAFPAASHVFVGAAIRHGRAVAQSYSAPFHVLLGDGGTTAHLYLTVTNVGALQLWRGDGRACNINGGSGLFAPAGTMLASSAAGLFDAGWHYIEIGATIDPSSGTAVVRFDNTTVISFTGNTMNGGTNHSIDAVLYQGMNGNWFGTPVDVGTPVLDDLYVCDSGGSVNNTFLGDVQVQTLLPSGAGTYTQLTPTGSGSNWQNVDEVPDDQSTFNSSATVGQRDTYALANLAGGTGSVLGVQTVMTASKSGAGAAGLKSALLIGGSLYYGATQSLGTTWTTYEDLAELNPATSAAWTASDVNGMEAGAEVA